jgi:hypothetical protein
MLRKSKEGERESGRKDRLESRAQSRVATSKGDETSRGEERRARERKREGG